LNGVSSGGFCICSRILVCNRGKAASKDRSRKKMLCRIDEIPQGAGDGILDAGGGSFYCVVDLWRQGETVMGDNIVVDPKRWTRYRCEEYVLKFVLRK